MSKKQTFNPLSGNFDLISEVTIGTANGLSIDVNQALSLAQATSSTPGAVLNVGSALGVATLDASGLVPITQLPPAAIERLVIVADQTARYALTTATVQNGDTVQQTDTGEMFYVKDDTNLNNAAGYAVYTAGTASSVPWSGITGIPAPVTALSGTNTGDVTIGTANGLSIAGQALSLTTADGATTGALTSTDWTTFNNKGTGSVTDVSVVTANGVSGSVATSTTTPAITLTLGAITPSSVASVGTVTGSNLSGTNTGDVTLAAVGAVPNANGATLTGQVLNLQPFNSTNPGVVSASGGGSLNYARADGTWALPGPINYIGNAGFETNATGYSAYANAAGAVPVTGTGGSPTVTIARSATTPLLQTASGLFTKGASNLQGQGFSYDFTIDSAYQAKAFTIQFLYNIASGTYANGDMTVWIYDITNGVMIQPSGSSILNNIGATVQKAEFQTSSNSTSYRLIFHVSSVSALAYTMQVDNVSVSPNTYNIGAVVTDFDLSRQFTPNNFGTVTNSNFWTRRVGDSLEVQGYFMAGTVAAATASFSLPAGLTMNTARMGAVGSQQMLGSWMIQAASTATSVFGNSTAGNLFYDGSDATKVFLAYQTGSGAYVKVNATTIAYNNGYTTFKFTVPILSWSTSQVLSSETSTNVVAASFGGTAASASTGAAVLFPNTYFDTNGSYNPATGGYTVSTPGYYQFDANLVVTNNLVTYKMYKNGAVYNSGVQIGYSQGNVSVGSNTIPAVAGDVLDIRPTSGATGTFLTGTNVNVKRLSGPAQISAAESVNARYHSATATITSSFSLVTYTTKDFDSNGSYVSGVFTAPSPGKYSVNAKIGVSMTGVANQNCGLSIYKNGAAYAISYTTEASGVNGAYPQISDLVQLNAGETVSIYTLSTDTSPIIAASTNTNTLSIVRVGN